ncbi:purine nucleosidase [Faunimonas pinastri]|uniref:Purine nucleosidase n=1 Tax=Faunimonas pinastri TaxID=1855383 RepID=A0A1H9CPT1_9HYPH|nr:nucleoside hydrolase [Faunimonas pinastri]SEQ03164.1 purine nucleosidase [Faunimonas pinastri]
MRPIIDTDTAGDDCFSLLLALRDPAVKLEAITICNGNVQFEQQVENALYTVEVAGRGGTVPVHPGCPRPMLRKPLDAAYVFGRDGMSDANFHRAQQRPDDRHAIDAIVDRVMANPGEITILAQAPLTNIAAAYVKEPRIAENLRHLWIMGGTDNALGNVTSAAEFNFYVDPEAAKIVLNAGFRTSVVTWTATVRDAVLSPADLSEIEAMDTPLSRFFTQVNRASVEFSMKTGRLAGSVQPDSVTCACMLDESLVLESADCVIDVEVAGELTRGYSSVSHATLPDQAEADPELGQARGANARVVKRIDTAGYRAMLMKALAS